MIRRELAWVMLVKLIALALLWLFFFSPPHRNHVDDAATSRQLGIGERS